MKYNYIKQLFAPETNTIITTDVEPAISIDHNLRLVSGIKKLQEVLGVTNMTPMAEGSMIKVYKNTKYNTPSQVTEGNLIPLTEYKRALAASYEITLKKYRKQTTAEAIQRSGRARAIDESDTLLQKEVQKDVKASFFTTLLAGTGTATAAATFQAQIANVWGAVTAYYEDIDATPVYFVNPADVATYLGSASITLQNAFGLTYVEDFMGLGTVIMNSAVTAGTIVGTAKENLNGAYVPAGGDLAQTFGLTFDQSGMVGMKHFTKDDYATVDTLLMSGVVFYAEDAAGIFKGTMSA